MSMFSAPRSCRSLGDALALLGSGGIRVWPEWWPGLAEVSRCMRTGVASKRPIGTARGWAKGRSNMFVQVIQGHVADAARVRAQLDWTAPGILEALIPGRMQSHACTAEVPR